MDQIQQLHELFLTYDSDKDGEVNGNEVYHILADMKIDYIYQGSVTKMIGKLNYSQKDKLTINFQQLREYYLSFASENKHSLFKAKFTVHQTAHQIKDKIYQPNQGSAAPGTQSKPQNDKPEQAHVSVIVGPLNATYKSQLEIHIEKLAKQEPPKPFIKLQITCADNEAAKKTEQVFKECFNGFFKILAQQAAEWKDEFDKVQLKTAVINNNATFFVTTTSEDVLEIIKIGAQFLDEAFGVHFQGNAHLNYQFDYDFEKFVKQSESTLYEMLTKNCKIQFNGEASILRFIRKFALRDNVFYGNTSQEFPLVSALHLESCNVDLEFQNSECENIELETKQEQISALTEFRQFLKKLDEGGMKIYELLPFVNDMLSLQIMVGEWKMKANIRVKNLNKLILEEFAEVHVNYDGY